MKDEKQSKQLRLSLRIKWALAVAVGIFVTFILFSFLIYQNVGNVLFSHERDTVRNSLMNVSQPFENTDELSQQIVINHLLPPQNQNKSNRNRRIITVDAKPDLSVSIYDVNQKRLFESSQTKWKTNLTRKPDLRIISYQGKRRLVGTQAIYNRNHKLIGYVEVMDLLTQYYKTMQSMRMMLYGLSFFAFIVCAAIGYLLATHFLKPIKKLTLMTSIINSDPRSTERITTIHENDELGDLVQQFNEMLDKIQHTFKQQEEFVQDVSHELRTPVAVLEGHLQLLNRWGKDDPKVLSESLDASMQEVDRMQKLIEEMLTLSRADQVEWEDGSDKTDVSNLVEQVYHDFEMLHQDFHFTLDEDTYGPVWAKIYRGHLEQILIILLDNAVKYSNKRREIHLSLSSDQYRVLIAVQDFGYGMTPEEQEQVFNRFYRVDKARSRDKGGNGLGLSIAAQLVKNYQGEISVDSVKGSGSVFTIAIPKTDPPENDEK